MAYIDFAKIISLCAFLNTAWVTVHYDHMTSMWIIPPLISFIAYITYANAYERTRPHTRLLIGTLVMTAIAVGVSAVLAYKTDASTNAAALLYLLNISTSLANSILPYQYAILYADQLEWQPIIDPV